MSKNSMCSRKVSFRTKTKAQEVADRFKQRIYECPICFCWHLTSLENWRDEFVYKKHMEVRLAQQESEMRHEMNRKCEEYLAKIAEMQKEIKLLKAGIVN